jgi:hypothetical protein
MEKRQRNVAVRFWVAEDERHQMKTSAERRGLNLSAWLRVVTLEAAAYAEPWLTTVRKAREATALSTPVAVQPSPSKPAPLGNEDDDEVRTEPDDGWR